MFYNTIIKFNRYVAAGKENISSLSSQVLLLCVSEWLQKKNHVHILKKKQEFNWRANRRIKAAERKRVDLELAREELNRQLDYVQEIDQMQVKNDVLTKANCQLTRQCNIADETLFAVKKQINISTKELHDINEQLLQVSEREKALQMEMQACKQQVDEINNHQLGLKQACESADNENQSHNKSIETLILELTNQRILHKLQSFIENIQKIEIIVETVKKEESEKIMDLFQNITTLFGSTLNQAQILRVKAQKAIQSYGREILLRRKYFNIIQELKGNIRVFCRIRPLTEHELACGETMSVEFLNERSKTRAQHWEETNCQFIASHNSLQIKNKVRNKTVCFDHVFEPSATQEEVFESTKQFITSLLDGYNVCIFVKYLLPF
ncbi:kinesin-like protein Klp2, partial [Reticulomyxa filosa]